jgi:kynureninase
VLTGWFSEFGTLAADTRRFRPSGRDIAYGAGAARSAGATYDATSHYRAAAVFAFHERMGLVPALLREVSRHQVGLLREGVEAFGVDPALVRVEPVPEDRRGGFLAIRSPRAAALHRAVRARGVLTDFRGDVLRLGPAPYLSDDQLREAVSRLGEAILA